MKTQFNYPEYAEINGVKYKINTDFRVAIRCNELTMDRNIDELERGFAIVFLLFGKEGLNAIKKDINLIEEFCEKARKYLLCGNDKEETKETPDMDFVEDMPYIEASFMSDYNISLEDTQMHWWKFYYLINGLSNSDMGNCCVLNRIRNLRNFNTKDIKDIKERHKIEEAKRKVALKRYQKEKPQATETQLKSAENFLSALGIGKE